MNNTEITTTEQVVTEKPKLFSEIARRLEARFGSNIFSFTDLVDFSNYDQEVGFYFGRNAGIKLFGAGDKPLVYSEIDDHSAFKEKIKKLHKDNPDAYKTPVEIHSPYYAIGVAREMEVLFELGNIEPIIYEIGAGRATLAKDMLDYWKKYNPELYKKVKYRILDASPKLVSTQKERLGEHDGRVEWIEADARNIPFADKSIEGVLVDTELLDNLPTACIKRIKQTPGRQVSLDDFVEEGYQVKDGQLIETEMPISDTVKAYVTENPKLLELQSDTIAPTMNIEVGRKGYLGIGVRNFYKELARVFKKGYVISFDYCSLPTEEKGNYMGMSVHRGDKELGLEENIGQADIYFSVDCWAANNMARRFGFQDIQFCLPEGQLFRRVFEGDEKEAEHEYKQLLFKNDKYGPPPLVADFANTFALVHSIRLGQYPKNLYEKLHEITQRHQLQQEDLTLGRSSQS